MTSFDSIVRDALRSHPRAGGGFVRRLVEDAMPSKAATWTDIDHVLQVQRAWLAAAHERGCLFGASLAADPLLRGWRSIVVTDSAPTVAVRQFAAFVRASVADPDVELASGLFPTVDSGADVVALLRAICELDDVNLEGAHSWGASSTVSISFSLTEDVSSWIMCLSPTDSVPSTRRAPFTELIVRVKPTRNEGTVAVLGDCPATVYVADAPTTLDGHDFNSAWRQTEGNVDAWLGADDEHYAAARVTCVLPTAEWFGESFAVDRRRSLADKLARGTWPDAAPTVPWTGHDRWITSTLNVDPR